MGANNNSVLPLLHTEQARILLGGKEKRVLSPIGEQSNTKNFEPGICKESTSFSVNVIVEYETVIIFKVLKLKTYFMVIDVQQQQL